jgi:hypothetical protein
LDREGNMGEKELSIFETHKFSQKKKEEEAQ